MAKEFGRWAICGLILPAAGLVGLVCWVACSHWGRAVAVELGGVLGEAFIVYLIFFTVTASLSKSWAEKQSSQGDKPGSTPRLRLILAGALLAVGFVYSIMLCCNAWFLAGAALGPGAVFAVGGVVEEIRRKSVLSMLAGLLVLLNGGLFAMNAWPKMHYLKFWF
ncbi:MAG: hypothetical protein BIFFINMI_02360 [Phycisphaerae bacterium]|nr:hypothetical protein [Phycisphaerae bacterium]